MPESLDAIIRSRKKLDDLDILGIIKLFKFNEK
jgi:hypothetical protein